MTGVMNIAIIGICVNQQLKVFGYRIFLHSFSKFGIREILTELKFSRKEFVKKSMTHNLSVS